MWQVGLAPAHPLKRTKPPAWENSARTWFSCVPPYPFRRWSSEDHTRCHIQMTSICHCHMSHMPQNDGRCLGRLGSVLRCIRRNQHNNLNLIQPYEFVGRQKTINLVHPCEHEAMIRVGWGAEGASAREDLRPLRAPGGSVGDALNWKSSKIKTNDVTCGVCLLLLPFLFFVLSSHPSSHVSSVNNRFSTALPTWGQNTWM